MSQLENVLKDLRSDIQEMALLVQSQLNKSRKALLEYDCSMASEVLHVEKRVNAMELRIDKICENIVALYNPVATDMRSVFAYYKINSHLERMGDYAKNIAYTVLDLSTPYDENLLQRLNLPEMFDTANEMIGENIVAIASGQPESAHDVFEMDIRLNELHKKDIDIIVETIQENPSNARALLELASIVRRLERVGDYNTNIAEELIFCFEALVLKHKDSNK